jgi:hypothetical protein
MMLLREIATVKIHNLIILFICCLILVAIGVSALIPWRPKPILAFAVTGLQEMSTYLSDYYENATKSGKDIQTSDVVKYLENDCDALSLFIFSQEPASSYGSPFNFGIYLCLPKQLKSESPTIIAYTKPIKIDSRRIYRAVLFLNGTKMTAIDIRNYDFEKVLGGNAKVTPDFYYSYVTSKKDVNAGES